MLFVLAAFLLAIIANISAQLGQFLQPRRFESPESGQRLTQRQHGRHRSDAILQGRVAAAQKLDTVLQAYVAAVDACQCCINQGLVWCTARSVVHMTHVMPFMTHVVPFVRVRLRQSLPEREDRSSRCGTNADDMRHRHSPRGNRKFGSDGLLLFWLLYHRVTPLIIDEESLLS
jgi:hypothetical protein